MPDRGPHPKPSPDEVDAAEAIRRLGERRYAWPELCRLAGVEHSLADRLWRALGFPDVPPEAPVYTADDVRALEIATEGLDRLSRAERAEAVELMVREARNVSGHLGRIVEIQVETLGDLGRLGLRQGAAAQALERGIEHSTSAGSTSMDSGADSTRRFAVDPRPRRRKGRSWRSGSST
jgi:hypothetical protein